MLGLSLAIRVGKRVLGSLIDSLMSAVKGRATYSENIADSKQVVKDIDNYELLDKASILLTPTAYSDARVHSVKTYTGDELVTNGTYSTDLSGWTNTNTHWQWSSGSAYHPLTTSFNPLKQDITNNVGAVLRITFDLTYVQGTAQCFYKNEANSDVSTTFTSSGSYTIITEPVKANTEINFGRAFGHNTEFYIDNVSVIDVSSDFDFDRASSATRINSDGLVQDMQSITDPELVLNGDFEELSSEYITNGDFSDGETGWTKGGAASATQSVVNGALVMYAGSASDANNSLSRTNTPQGYNGKTYKLELTVSDMLVSSTGFIRLDSTYDASNIISFGTGTSTIYFTAYRDFTHIRFFAGSAEDGYTIDNVSVKEVPNWTLGAGWSIEDGKAVRVASSSTDLVQVSVFPNLTSIFKITFDVVRSAGSVRLRAGTFNLPYVGATDTYTYYVTPTSNDQLKFQADSSFEGSIDNVSVQQVDPNDRWTAQNGWTLQDGLASFEGTVSSYRKLFQENFLTIGNTYELSFEILSISSGSIANLEANSPSFDTVGVKTQTFVATFDDLFLEPTNDANLTIDNISVKDITFSEDVDLARINYDSNGENGHWLLEPTSTNLITYSEDFSEWELAAVTVEGGYLAPDGSNNAYKVSGTVGSSSIYFVGVNATDTRTIWARTVSGTGQAQLCSYFGNTNNLKTITNEWQRFEVVDTTTATGATNFYAIDFRGSTDLSEIIIWGAQSEALSHSTSYIPTHGSTVTRATETLTGSGNSTLINSTEGVLYAEIAALEDDLSTRIISLSDQTNTNRIHLFYFSQSNDLGVNYRVNGSTVVSFIAELADITNFSKVAFKWQSGDFKMYVDGVLIGTDTNTTMLPSNTINTLSFLRGDGVESFYGKCKALAVFDEALSDDELELLTGITNYGSFNELAQANGYTII